MSSDAERTGECLSYTKAITFGFLSVAGAIVTVFVLGLLISYWTEDDKGYRRGRFRSSLRMGGGSVEGGEAIGGGGDADAFTQDNGARVTTAVVPSENGNAFLMSAAEYAADATRSGGGGGAMAAAIQTTDSSKLHAQRFQRLMDGTYMLNGKRVSETLRTYNTQLDKVLPDEDNKAGKNQPKLKEHGKDKLAHWTSVRGKLRQSSEVPEYNASEQEKKRFTELLTFKQRIKELIAPPLPPNTRVGNITLNQMRDDPGLVLQSWIGLKWRVEHNSGSDPQDENLYKQLHLDEFSVEELRTAMLEAKRERRY